MLFLCLYEAERFARYRSAKDFEDYNVSGYVYDELTKNLYIKSKHKSESELVRLWCRPATNFSEK